jgi:hypothetical protein
MEPQRHIVHNRKSHIDFYVKNYVSVGLCGKNSFGLIHADSQFFISFKRKNLIVLIFAPAGLTRPAPAQPPQGRKAARISGCSGAM